MTVTRKLQPPSGGSAPSVADLSGDLGFIGNFPMNLDDKLRLMVPARFKGLLQQKYGKGGGSIEVVVTVSPDKHRNAAVYPIPEWKRYVAELQQAPLLNRYSQQLQRFVTSLATLCEMDSAGRVRLEKKIVEVARLEKRVIVVGCSNHFELWDEKRFDEFVEETIRNADSAADEAIDRM
jgi:MraZ protein